MYIRYWYNCREIVVLLHELF